MDKIKTEVEKRAEFIGYTDSNLEIFVSSKSKSEIKAVIGAKETREGEDRHPNHADSRIHRKWLLRMTALSKIFPRISG